MLCQMSQGICFPVSDGEILSSDAFAPILASRMQVMLFGCHVPGDPFRKT